MSKRWRRLIAWLIIFSIVLPLFYGLEVEAKNEIGVTSKWESYTGNDQALPDEVSSADIVDVSIDDSYIELWSAEVNLTGYDGRYNDEITCYISQDGIAYLNYNNEGNSIVASIDPTKVADDYRTFSDMVVLRPWNIQSIYFGDKEVDGYTGEVYMIDGTINISWRGYLSALNKVNNPNVLALLIRALASNRKSAFGVGDYYENNAANIDTSVTDLVDYARDNERLVLVKDLDKTTNPEKTTDVVVAFFTEEGVSFKGYLNGAEVALDNFDDILTELYSVGNVSTGDDLADYLINTYGSYAAKLKEEQENKANEENMAAIDAAAKTTYDRYAQLFVAYHNDKTDTFTTSSGVYSMNTFPLPQGADLPMSDEEILRLKAFLNIMLEKDDNSRTNKEYPSNYDKVGWLTNVYPQVDLVQPTGVIQYNIENVKQNAEAISLKYSELGVSTVDWKRAIYHAEDLAKYYTAKVYGCTPDTEDETDISHLTRSDYLESIIPKSTDPPMTVLNFKYIVEGNASDIEIFKGIPQMERIAVIAGTPEAYEAYYDLNYLLVLAATYASDEYTGCVDGKNEKLEDFLEECGGNSENVSNESLAKVQDIITSYMAIAGMLDYLGIKPWTDCLERVVSYYNQLSAFEGLLNGIDIEYIETDEAMKGFFSVGNRMFHEDYREGVALSATYKPLVTNLYDASSVSFVDDPEWVMRFHYPYGFYRKALYIDTNINSAVEKYVTEDTGSNTSKGLRVATLEDLLQPERDIVLYVDESFYNIDELAKAQGYTYTKLQNTEDAGEDDSQIGFFENITQTFQQIVDTDIETIAKTGGNTTYARNIKREVSEFGSDEVTGTKYVLADNLIEEYLNGYSSDGSEKYHDTYTPIQSFAVVSAIYRDSSLYNLLKKEVSNPSPVFVSSPTLAAVTNVDQKGFNSIYNYAMLKNLEKAMGFDYRTKLDENSALYIDIYGNILTDSGLVVIPAMSNATLCNPSAYSLATVGFTYLYNIGEYEIPETYKNANEKISSLMVVDNNTGTWKLGTKIVNSVQVNFDNIPLQDIDVLMLLKSLASDNLNKSGKYLPFEERVYLITEVLRGAPLDRIDKAFEGLEGNTSVDKVGIIIASKLEDVGNMILNGIGDNSIVTLPNLAFMDGVEYIILFAFKIIFAVLLILLFYRAYIDAVQGIGFLRCIVSFIVACVTFLAVMFAIPSLLDISYYQMNKTLLQKETQEIALLNLEKQVEGREIGVSRVTSPESKTELYLKVDDMSIPWYEILDDVLFSNSIDTISEAYDAEFDNSLLADLPRFVRKGENLYISVNDVFENCSVEYDAETNTLYTWVRETPYESYVTPYYAILDSLVARINRYNYDYQVQDYNIKTMSGGSVKTSGLITPYLTSTEFMNNSQDITGLKAVYGIDTTYEEVSPFSSSDVESMENSLWFKDPDETENMDERISSVDEKVKYFVSCNIGLLGKVTDDTFLKVMALVAACEHNDEFNVGAASAIEIYEVDARDIIRLSLEDSATVMKESSKSFARFVYDESGTLGVIVTSLLIVMYVISAFMKPLCLIIIIGCMVSAAVIRRVIKKDTLNAVEGMLVTAAIMCGVNILYSVVLKISLAIPELGTSLVVSALIQIVIQFVYLYVLVSLTLLVLSDWKNVGLFKFAQLFERVMVSADRVDLAVQHALHRDSKNIFYGGERHKRSYKNSSVRTGRDLLEQLHENDRIRRSKHGRR